MTYTIKNLREVEDVAPSQGFDEAIEARFARRDLGSEQSGVSYQVVKRGNRQPFAHKHAGVEEIYVVLSGSGRVKLDEKIEDVGPLDAIRIAPSAVRAFEAGDEDLALLVFSPLAEGDFEIVTDFNWE